MVVDVGNWDDVGAAKEAAVAQLRQGADVLIHNTDAASFGVFQAVREAVASGTPEKRSRGTSKRPRSEYSRWGL